MRRRGVLISFGLVSLMASFGRTSAGPRERDTKLEPTRWSRFAPSGPDSILVAVEAGGTTSTALLDTGAPATVIDSRVAVRLGIAVASQSSVRGNVGQAQVGQGGPVTLRLAGYAIELSSVAIIDLAPVVAAGGGSFDMVLGRDAFREVILDLDLPGGRFALHPRPGFSPPNAAARLALTTGSRQEPTIPISIESHPSVAATLDLGSSNALMLSGQYVSDLGLLRGRRTSSAATGGVDGINISTTTSFASVRFGQTVLADVPAEIFDHWYSRDVPANVGLPVLRRYRLILDFAGGVAWLLADPASLSMPYARDLSGLGLAVEPDRLRVVHVAKNGPAEGTWHLGEEIVAVDGHAIDPSYPTSELAGWRNGPPGRAVTLTLAGGQTRRLVLTRYY